MNVRELIKLLEKQNPYAEVVLARDPEGNGFSSTTDFSKGWWSEKEQEYSDDPESERFEDDAPAFLLWPDR